MTQRQWQILVRLIDLVAVIANEQATREFSGDGWGKRTTSELMDMLQAFKADIPHPKEKEEVGK